MKTYLLIIGLLIGNLLASYGNNSISEYPDNSEYTSQTIIPKAAANYNYIKETVYLRASETPLPESSGSTLTTMQYFDGFGKPTLHILKNQTQNNQDLITYQAYDNRNRTSKTYIPVPYSLNGMYINQDEVRSLAQEHYNDAFAYSETHYEESPEGRVNQEFGTGQNWAHNNKAISFSYRVNEEAGNFSCNCYVITNNDLYKKGTYPAGELHITIVTDEDGNQTYTFKNKENNPVLIRQFNNWRQYDTYYVYDLVGNKRFVLPPLASDRLQADNVNLSQQEEEIINKYAYCYRYNAANKCIMKKFPGADPVYFIYDRAGRLRMSQDGNQRTKKEWTYFKYDHLNREIMKGTVITVSTPTSLKDDVDYYEINELFDITQPDMYTCQSAPTQWGNNRLKSLIVNYYDDYDFLTSLPANTQNTLAYQAKTGYGVPYNNARGLLTGTRIYLLNDPTKYITTVYYYSDKGEIIQERSTNILNGYDAIYNEYDFTGNLLKTFKEQKIVKGNGQIITNEVYKFTYDHASRLVKTTYKLNDLDSVVLCENNYDELGRLATRYRHNRKDTLYQEYNIRNWITKIKNGTFEEDVFYETNPTNILLRYNGNISATRRKYNGTTHGYVYYYDNLNRLTTADYRKGQDMTYGSSEYEESFEYDKHGNILRLMRCNPTYGPIDMLTMEYEGNQVISVFDEYGSRNRYDLKEYQGTYSTDQSFWYDNNGNRITDLDKNIVTIRYNLLNLPDTIQFKNGNQIVNTYTADGRKLRKDYFTVNYPLVVPMSSVCQLEYEHDMVEHYADIYLNNIHYNYYADVDDIYLEYIRTGEGYVELKNPINYYYYRRDHLGNNCESLLVLGDRSGVMQRTQYYPSGLPWAEGLNPSRHPYKFGDKEFIETHGYDRYDFTGRTYYSALMQFDSQDPMAEKYYAWSPYVYCMNNPIKYIDLRGDSITVANDEASRNDIASIVNKKNRNYITYDENGNMSINFGNISQKEINKVLKKNKGLNLLNNLINATTADGKSQNFYYATTNERKGIDPRNGEDFNITLNKPEGTVVIDNSFATNLTNIPKDTSTQLLPEKGYDGTIRISPGTMYNIAGGEEYIVNRNQLIYHELSENYLMTNKGMKYKEAHAKAGGTGNFSRFIWGK